MPTVIDVKVASFEGKFSLVLIQNLVSKQQEFRLIYLVVADNFSQDPVAIAATTGLPVLGTNVYGAFCNKIEPKATDTVIHYLTGALTQLWEVEATFSTMMRDNTTVIPQVNWGGELDKEHLEFDLLTGAKPVTTAGEPLFIERQVSQPILSIRRQESWPYDPGTLVLYSGRVNSTTFWGFPPGSCLMMPIKVEEDTQNSTRIVWVTYEIKIRVAWNYDGTMMSDTWQSRPLNQGHYFRKSIGAQPEVARDKNNIPIMVNLDAYGQRILDINRSDLAVSAPSSLSLNPVWLAYGTLGDAPVPTAADIGSSIIIKIGSPASFIPGIYLIQGIKVVSGTPFWVLDGVPATGGMSASGGLWQLQKSPLYLFFNRAYPIDFNALTLGPF